MRLGALFVGLMFSAMTLAPANAEPKSQGDKKVVIDFDGMKSAAPAEWKEEPLANQMRFAQFKLPKHKDDKEDAELVIFKGLGGSAKQNIERWQAQFAPPKGKSIDEATKIEELKIGGCAVTYVDIAGSFRFKDRPFDPAAKEELRPDYRMLAVHFDGKKDVYHIKLTGQAKTVDSYKKGFDDWLKAFK